MMRLRYFGSLVALAMSSILFIACSNSPGRPKQGAETPVPSEVADFPTLYAQNCAACHGAEGRGGAAIALANPVYLAVVNKDFARKAIANGVHGTSMPAFAQSAGGMLTDKQVDVISSGMFSNWARNGILDGTNPPLYATKSAGDATHGEAVYRAFCASCHGAHGEGSAKGSNVTDGTFLALVSDQGLRTLVITGRPELGAPDWRGNVPGKPMSDQEITDVVAWLASLRVKSPGQPYSASNFTQH
jgi:cytochrome c oxidase cbb3-type subunit III